MVGMFFRVKVSFGNFVCNINYFMDNSMFMNNICVSINVCCIWCVFGNFGKVGKIIDII